MTRKCKYMKKNNKFTNFADVQIAVQNDLKVILTSTSQVKIQNAMKELICIVSGSCICDLCPEWNKDLYVLFELGRCLVTTHTMQLIKTKHIKTARWIYVKPLYTELYNTLFGDIAPNDDDYASITFERELVSSKMCRFKLTNAVMEKTMTQIQDEQSVRGKMLKKLLNADMSTTKN